jgi:hypothetical protein
LSQNQWHPDPDVNKAWEVLMEALHRWEEIGGKTTLVLIPESPEDKILVAINGRAVPGDVNVAPREYIASAMHARGQDVEIFDIITQYSGDNRSPGEMVDGNAKEVKILLRKNDGSVEELFVGPEFYPKKWLEKMEWHGKKSTLEDPSYIFNKKQ